MAIWRSRFNWMAFQRLDESEGLTCSFTIAYKITKDDSGEVWSERFSRFKAHDAIALSGGVTLMMEAVPALVAGLDLKMAQTVFVPALSSGETAASERGQLPTMARLCAKAAGARFQPNALKKHVHRPLSTLSNVADRAVELDRASYESVPLHAESVLIFDDFITRGSTLSRIAQAILTSNPSVKIYGLALGKTERRTWAPNLSNAHVPQQWNTLWEQGEQRYREGWRVR